jgi:hypothetical protein
LTAIPAEFFNRLSASQVANSPDAWLIGELLLHSARALLSALMVLASPRGTYPAQTVVLSGSIVMRHSPEFHSRGIGLCDFFFFF